MPVPADNLLDALRSFSPRALEGEEYDAYYLPDIIRHRGSDVVKRIQTGLRSQAGHDVYRCYLVGTSGSGKSTEMERFRRESADKYEFLTVSAREHLDITSFQPFDFLYFVATEIAERTHRLTGVSYPADLLDRLQIWGSEITEREMTGRNSGLEFDAGVETKTPGLLGSVFSAFARFKSSMRFTSARSKETVLYLLNRIDSLATMVNEVLDHSNEALRKQGKEWLIIAEDFDKADVSPDSIRRLVGEYGTTLRGLRANLVLNVPQYALTEEKAGFQPVELTDVPMFGKDHKPRDNQVDVYRQLIARRAQLDLFDGPGLEAAIFASGGLLSTLFRIIADACLNALEQDAEAVDAEHFRRSLKKVRSEFRLRLSNSPFEKNPIPPDEKLERLQTIYEKGSKAYMPDELGRQFINLQLVLTHNDEYWYSVHPLIVDLLASRDIPTSGGGTPVGYV